MCCVAQLQISLTYKVVELVQIDMPARPPRSERRTIWNVEQITIPRSKGHNHRSGVTGHTRARTGQPLLVTHETFLAQSHETCLVKTGV